MMCEETKEKNMEYSVAEIVRTLLDTVPLYEALSVLYCKYRGEVQELASCTEWNNVIPSTRKREIKTVALYYYKLGEGGVERVISLLMPMFLKQGYKVILITDEKIKATDFAVPEAVIVHQICNLKKVVANKVAYKERAEELQEIIKRENVDVMCYHLASTSLLFYDMIAVKALGVRFVLERHELFSFGFQCGEEKVLNALPVYRWIDRLVVLSKTEELFWKTLSIDAKYVPNPHNIAMRKEKQKKGTSIIWVGRLEKMLKQYQEVVPIMKQVVEKYPEAILKIYGSGNEQNIAELTNQIDVNNLKDNVFYCGYSKNVEEVYEEAKVLLVTSSSESFGMQIFESKIKGIPLVTYEMPYLEMLKNKKGYIAVPQGDYVAAANALVQIFTDEKLYAKLGEEALESVEGFENDKVYAAWEEVFKFGLTKESIRIEKEYEIIIKELAFQHSKGCLVFKKNEARVKELEILSNVLMALRKNDLKVALYPFGALGQQVKKVLGENGVPVDLILDNKLSKTDSRIKAVNDLADMDVTGYKFFLCSDRGDIYEVLRSSLLEYVEESRICDLFPKKV